jgi:predicted RNA binding protein YcfA (HicA-like mRNA interferase family)
MAIRGITHEVKYYDVLNYNSLGINKNSIAFSALSNQDKKNMPKKIRELKSMLIKAGFVLLPKRGKGSHSIYRHPLASEDVKLSGNDGKDAKRYQEADVKRAIEEVKNNER